MQLEIEPCVECSGPLVDAGDELVCPRCGIVKEKSVVDAPLGGGNTRPDRSRYPLGSYMGPKGGWGSPKTAGAFANYGRMKLISDSCGYEGGLASDSGKLIERVCDRLNLPRVVAIQATSMSKKIVSSNDSRRRLLAAEVSAYSIVASCRIEGIMAVSIREILRAHLELGRKVTSSSLFHLALESPVKTYAKRPEDYIVRVLARLSMNPRLLKRLKGDGTSAPAYFNALREAATRLLASCDRIEMVGKRPCALAASAVFSAEVLLASHQTRGRRVTQKEMAACGDTSEYTIREQCASILMPEVKRILAADKLLIAERASP